MTFELELSMGQGMRGRKGEGEKLEAGLTPYDDYLVRCDFTSCQQCKHSARCAYTSIQQMTEKVGAVYKTFVHGQDRSEFSV